MTRCWLRHFAKPGIISTNALICRSKIKILRRLFFSHLPRFLTDNFITPLSSSASCPLLSCLINPSITFLVSFHVPQASAFMWWQLERREVWVCLCACICACVCVHSFLYAMRNSRGLFQKVKLSIPREEATQQPIAAPQFCERSDSLRGNSVLISIPLRLRKRLRLFTARVGCLLMESGVNGEIRQFFGSREGREPNPWGHWRRRSNADECRWGPPDWEPLWHIHFF